MNGGLSDGGKFPMQGGPPITWDIALIIYRAYAAVFGIDQSLERIAQRGGFRWAEVDLIGKAYIKRYGHPPDGWRR